MLHTVMRLSGLGALALVLAGTGLLMAQALAARVVALALALQVVEATESALVYSLAPPDEIVAALQRREGFVDAPYLAACAARCSAGEPFPRAWRSAVLETHGALAASDADLLASLSETLGRCDLETQRVQLAAVRGQLALSLEHARTQSETRGRLYRTLGMLAGAFLFIVLV